LKEGGYMGLTITVIGGGSSYTPELMNGLLLRAERLPTESVRLVDIPEGRRRLEVVAGLLQRMAAKHGSRVKIETYLDRRRALRGADVVISQFRVGGLRARSLDEKLPLRHGVIGQETTGPGGFAKALRTIPVALEIARDVMEVCPEAWLLNFTNPAGMVTEAVLRHVPGVKCLGLCNVPLSMVRAVCDRLGVAPSDVEVEMVGLNHLSWVRSLLVRGQDILPAVLSSDLLKEELVRNIPGAEVPPGFLEALGMMPSPYLLYYYLHPQMLAKMKADLRAGKGTRADVVRDVEERLFRSYADPAVEDIPKELAERGGSYYSEAALDVLDALVNDLGTRHVLNVPNGSATPDLPPQAVMEVTCVVDGEGARPLPIGPLPTAVRGLVQHVKAYEELTIEAAVSGDREVALLALLNHPLVGDVTTASGLLADILEKNQQL